MLVKSRRGQAAIEYVTVLTIMLIMMIMLGQDLLTSTMASTAGSDADLLLKATEKNLALAAWEVEHLKTFRSITVQVPAGCKYTVEDQVVWSYCYPDPSDTSKYERRVLVASKKIKITSDPSGEIGKPASGSSSTGVIRIAPAE